MTVENATIVTLEGMAGAQVFEFSPDVIGKIQRHRQRKRDEKEAAQAAADAARISAPPASPAP